MTLSSIEAQFIWPSCGLIRLCVNIITCLREEGSIEQTVSYETREKAGNFQ
jgi:hypothetical protein